MPLVIVFCLLFGNFSWSDTMDANAFLKRAKEHWQILSSQEVPIESVNNLTNTFYLPLQKLIRGQDEISVDNILAKFEEKKLSGDVVLDSIKNEWIAVHDNGQSLVPLTDPIQVIKGPKGYLIIDGHHDVFLSLFLKAKTIAVVVREDWSKDSTLAFWQKLKQRNFIYLKKSPEELASEPPKMEDVKDNPNRYLAALLALKVVTDKSVSPPKFKSVKGPSFPVWIKVDDSVAFIEFHIAEILRRTGVVYSSSWKESIPSDITEKARQTLASVLSNDETLKLIPILDNKDEAVKLRTIPEYLYQFLFSN